MEAGEKTEEEEEEVPHLESDLVLHSAQKLLILTFLPRWGLSCSVS